MKNRFKLILLMLIIILKNILLTKKRNYFLKEILDEAKKPDMNFFLDVFMLQLGALIHD